MKTKRVFETIIADAEAIKQQVGDDDPGEVLKQTHVIAVANKCIRREPLTLEEMKQIRNAIEAQAACWEEGERRLEDAYYGNAIIKAMRRFGMEWRTTPRK